MFTRKLVMWGEGVGIIHYIVFLSRQVTVTVLYLTRKLHLHFSGINSIKLKMIN